jgi:DNA polymerase III subunit gamma/tau
MLPPGLPVTGEASTTFVPVSYQSLYRRYRPQRFGELRGQEHVANALRNAVRNDTVLHAYLFSGPRGTGKTSSARILAKALNCTNLQDGEPCCACESCQQVVAGSSMDVIELDAASNNGVDAMRDLVGRASLGTAGRRKVYIVDEVHMLSPAASNALLKTLEEPPDHVVFVLATTDPQKVLQTIISRTQHFEFRLAALDTLTDHLHVVAADAGIELDPDTITQVARKGNGSFRDALSALDQVAALGHLDQAAGNLEEIIGAVASRDAAGVLSAVGSVIDQGRDPRQIVRDLVGVLRECFLSLMAPGAARSSASAADLAQRMGAPLVVRSIEVLGEAGVSMRDALDPRVSLEVALVKLVRPDLDSSASAIMARLDQLERARSAGGPVESVPGHPETSSSQIAPPSQIASSTEPASPSKADVSHGTVANSPEPPAVDAASAPARPAPSAAPASVEQPTRGTVNDARAALTAIKGGRTGAQPNVRPIRGNATSSPPASGAGPAGGGQVSASADLGATKDAWMAQIESRMTRAMYNAGRLVSVSETTAVFALPNEMTAQRCRDKSAEVIAALAQVLGRPITLELITEAGPSGVPDDPEGIPARPSESPASAARTAMANPAPKSGPGRSLPGPDDAVDLSELSDAPEVSPIDAIMNAFPGTQIVER